MKLTNKTLAPLIIICFIVGIAGTMIFNLWQTESSKEPAKIKSGEYAGMSDPFDIRGSYSFDDIKKSFNIDVEILGKAFGVQDYNNLNEFQCKQLEEIYSAGENGEVGTGSVRLFVALYNKLPYTLDDETLLPSPAISLLKDKVTEEELSKLKKISINLSEIKNSSVESEHSESEDEKKIKGKTTFNELLQWGLSSEEIETVIGKPMGKSGETVRDFCSANEIEFSGVKTKLQDIIDMKK